MSIGKGNTILGKKSDIYLNSKFTSKAGAGLSGRNLWYFDVIEQVQGGYKVQITKDKHGNLGSKTFNPSLFYLKNEDVQNVVLNNIPKPPTINTGGELQTGDTMILSDVNGKRIGVWTFKKE